VNLEQLLKGVDVVSWNGARDVEIGSIAYHSDEILPGGLFVVWKGQKSDGHDYIKKAVLRGSAAVLGESEIKPFDKPYVRVKNPRAALARAAANFFSNPSAKMKVIGVTGTNGKTSTTTLIQYLFGQSGCKTGLVGTVAYDLGDGTVPADRTTPEGLDLQRYLSMMLQHGCGAAVMEVSSHALDQGRVEGIDYGAAVFTNLTQDHLDYHETMDRYFEAKGILFKGLSAGSVAVLNANDGRSGAMKEFLAKGVRCLTYGIDAEADFSASKVVCEDSGSQFVLRSPEGEFQVQTPWIGLFNVSNVLAAVATCHGLGESVARLVDLLKTSPFVPGRLERVAHKGNFSVVVDYAHTDDAVRKALEALRPLTKGELKILIGCGGNRDKGKRPRMAKVACELADRAIFTSDNPRYEDPSEILKEMVAGVPDKKNYEVIEDRARAIDVAIKGASSGDVILIAGKGHESTQEIQGVYQPFVDKDMAGAALKRRGL
jgi:UDP-N-acetylmuramoyl-L-alanyl-D-glutamate--2,6-diaminopimelate ligase